MSGLEAVNFRNLEIYLLIIQKLQSELNFKDADHLLGIFENLKEQILQEDGVLLR